MEHRNSVLIVEDDVNINGLLKEALEKEGYICTQAFSGTEARMILQGERYSVILLDLMLPGIPGEEVLRDIRKKGNTPVIILTAKDTIDDKVEFLRGGADDYVTKPFDIKEVTARVEVQIRRAETTGRKEEEHRFTYQELELNKGDFTVKVGNTELPHITKQEFQTILHFALLMIVMCIALVIRNNVVSIVIGICLCMNALIIFYSFIDRMLAKVGLENFHMINYTVSGKITLLGTEITSEMAVTSLLVGFAFVAAAVCLGSFVFKKRDI